MIVADTIQSVYLVVQMVLADQCLRSPLFFLHGTPSQPSLSRGPWIVCILGMVMEFSLAALSCVDSPSSAEHHAAAYRGIREERSILGGEK